MSDYTRNGEDDTANGYSDFFASRVGLNFDAKAKGGASVHARLYFDDEGYNDDAIWNGSGDAQWGVSTDYAYFKLPLSDSLTLRAGRIPLKFTKFYSWEIRPTRVQLIYKSGNLKLVPFVGVVSENSTELDNWDDNDFMQYGIVPILKINDDWTIKAFMRYNSDQREWSQRSEDVIVAGTLKNNQPVVITEKMDLAGEYTPYKDRSGFDGTVNLSGTMGSVGLTAELAYKAADFQMTEDDGLGGYVQAAFGGMPGFTPVVLAGMTQDGFMAWRDFGFVMVGGNQPTTVVNVGNADGDLMFGALVLMHDISDRFSAQGNLLYASYDYDSNEAGKIDSAIEVSGVLGYALSESTSLEYKLGYLTPTYNDGAPSVLEDAYIGHALALNVEF
ncbi:MAG: hypothetical protein D3916_09255 [Candidatus Electrothrix sp. MAN1_4]|nr:hypothetical protein [Candidatus Electrothrix sp. MAN1_4]